MSGFAESNDPWFRIRNFDVTTTAAVVGVGFLSMLLYALEGASRPISSWFGLVPSAVAEGQVWRLFTWPIFNAPGFFVVIMLAVLYMLGMQLEALMGKRDFAVLIVLLIIIPAVAAVIGYVLFGWEFREDGLRMVELGVLVSFCAQFNRAKFFNLIPAPFLAGAIVTLQVLGSLGARAFGPLLMLVVTCAVALIGLRSLGHASDLEWIPSLGDSRSARPKRAAATSSSGPSRRPSRPSRPRRSRSGAKLEVVPSPPPMPSAVSPENNADIDSLLDKIAEFGMGSLSPSERVRLEQHSDRMRRQRGD